MDTIRAEVKWRTVVCHIPLTPNSPYYHPQVESNPQLNKTIAELSENLPVELLLWLSRFGLLVVSIASGHFFGNLSPLALPVPLFQSSPSPFANVLK